MKIWSEQDSAAAIAGREANEWLQRLGHADVSEEDIHAWLRWHGASEINRRSFEEVQAFHRQMRTLPDGYHAELRRRFKRKTYSSTPRRMLALAASFGAVLAGLAAMTWRAHEEPVPAVVYAAPADHHQTVRLDDGSALVLAESSVASVQYSRSRRLLSLRQGQAYFEVSHNRARPFVVEAGNVSVTAVGTAFNVSRQDDRVVVTVTNGVVDVVQQAPATAGAVAAPALHRSVAVGQRLVIANATGNAVLLPRAGAEWQDDRIQFVNAPLSQVLAAVNRYAAHPLVADDPSVADLSYTGTVFRQQIDEWAAALPTLYPVHAVPLEDGSLALVMARRDADTK